MGGTSRLIPSLYWVGNPMYKSFGWSAWIDTNWVYNVCGNKLRHFENNFLCPNLRQAEVWLSTQKRLQDPVRISLNSQDSLNLKRVGTAISSGLRVNLELKSDIHQLQTQVIHAKIHHWPAKFLAPSQYQTDLLYFFLFQDYKPQYIFPKKGSMAQQFLIAIQIHLVPACQTQFTLTSTSSYKGLKLAWITFLGIVQRKLDSTCSQNLDL